jgi:crotonobetainyl-CoA:carnitine CoA-transferase CaiB-like acyl-CoA transferase
MQNHIPKRIGSLHPNIAPYGEIFTTAEGELITLAIGSNKHFSLLCQFLGLENLLSDLKFSENASRVANRVELFETLQERIGQQQTAQLMDAMNKNYVPIGKIKNLAEVFSDSKTAKLIRDEQMEGKETKRVSQIAFTIQ